MATNAFKSKGRRCGIGTRSVCRKVIPIVKYVYIISLIILLASQAAFSQMESDLDGLNLKGKVKSVRVDRGRFSNDKEGKRALREELDFDENGNCTERVSPTRSTSKKYIYGYSPDGKIWRRTDLGSSETEVFTYQKNRIEKITRANDGHILDRWIYTFDENGRKIKDEYTLVDKNAGQRMLNPIDVTTYKYDTPGRLIETAYFKADGTPTTGLVFATHKYVNTYDNKDRMTEKAAYNLENKLVSKWLYRYGERGNLEEIAQYGPDMAPLTRITYQNFDASGNWTMSISYKLSAAGEKNALSATESEYRTITYYQ